jgi:hypothetical protein
MIHMDWHPEYLSAYQDSIHENKGKLIKATPINRRFSVCKRSVMTTHQCIDCMVADRCDDPNAEKEGKRIRLEIFKEQHD